MTTSHVIVSAEIHQHVTILTNMIHIHASVSVSLTNVQLISTLTMIPVVVTVAINQPVQATNISMNHRASATAVTSRSAAQENTTTMTRVTASAKIHQLAMLLTITTQIHVNASVDHMTAMLDNISTTRVVAVNVQSTRPA